jgi:pteridine reductase
MSVAMSDQNSQRVALVTGGAIRVGRAISLALAEAGYDLVVTYRSSVEGAADVQRLVADLGRACVLVQADLTDARAPESVAETANQTYGRLDLLVNSAASFDARPLLEVDAEAWDAVLALNVRAPHLLVRAASDLLRASGGSVVNIVDLSAFQPWLEYPAHAVSKAALAHLTRVQARALAPEVRVNAVAPGAVLPPDDWSEERWTALAEAAPLRRVGAPADVAAAVLFFAEADFVTGQILAVDGGRHMGGIGPEASA